MPPHIRRKIFTGLTAVAVFLFAAGLLLDGRGTSRAAVEGLRLCGQVLIPSLFPFFVVSQFCVRSGLADIVGHAFRRPMAWLFGLPGACAPAFVLGIIGGYPVGAHTAISLYQQRLCTKAEAERLLAFCNNSGPAFILGAVGAMAFGTTGAGVLLYGAHVTASVGVGLLLRRGRTHAPQRPDGPLRAEAMPLSRALTSAVSESAAGIVNICAFVIFFAVIIRLLLISGALPAAARALAVPLSPLGLSAEMLERLLSGLIEITSGVYGLTAIAAGTGFKLTAAAFMLGWAGLSVHCQVLAFIGQSGLRTGPYIVGKLLHGGISSVIVWTITRLLPFDAQVGKTLSGQVTALGRFSPSAAFSLALIAVMAVWGISLALGAAFRRKRPCKVRGKSL